MSKDQAITPAAIVALASGDLDNAIAALSPGGIERQELFGQLEQLTQQTMPIRLLRCTEDDFKALGFIFGDPVDDLFRQVKLPPGWRKRITESSYWTDILDEADNIRAEIFYKAAFYDRRAHVSLVKKGNPDA